MKRKLTFSFTRYRKLSLIAVTSLSVFGFTASDSWAGLPPKSSEDFLYLYEADVLPNEILPTENSFILRVGTTGGGNNAGVSGGILTISSPLTSHQYYEARAANWLDVADLSNGFTAEIRVKVDPGKTFGGIQLGFASDSNAGLAGLIVTGDDTQWRASSSENRVVDTARNDDGFHVFRLIKSPNTPTKAGRFTLYRDGVLIFDDEVGQESSEDRLFFGDYGSWDSAGQVDYFRWDTTGAYAPGPESTLPK